MLKIRTGIISVLKFSRMAASSRSIYVNVLATAVIAAEKAGEVIRDVMKSGNLGIILKGANDPQTAADRAAQVTISSILLKKFPKLTLIGEEGDIEKIDPNVPDYSLPDDVLNNQQYPLSLSDLREEDIVVWVDPLDGTNEFTKGLVEHVTVLIGLAYKGKPIGGVIHQPYWSSNEVKNQEEKKGRTIWGTVGGAMGGLSVISHSTEGGMILATTRSHSTESVEAAISALGTSQVLRVGGAGYKVLLLLEGKAHCYVFPTPGCKRWDTCAPEAILRAAGGVLTDTTGTDYSYDKDTPRVNTGGVLAALDLDIHKRCLDVLSQIKK